MTRDELIHRLTLALADAKGDRYQAIRRVMDTVKDNVNELLEAWEIVAPGGLRNLLPPDTRGALPVSLGVAQPPRADWTVGILRAHLLWIRRVRDGVNERLMIGQAIVKAAKSDDELLKAVLPRLPVEQRQAAERMLGLRTLAA